MWNRQDVKLRAKAIMKRNYWKMFVISLLASILAGESTANVTFKDVATNGDQSLQALIATIVSIIGVIALLYEIFIANPIRVGKADYFLKNHDENPPLSTLFSAFKSNYLNKVAIMLVMQIKILLWSILFIIPGVIKAYEYSMIPYILAEDGSLELKEVFAKSKQLTSGNKMNLFVLDLSFIGWYILCVITCGIGFVFLDPYHSQTWIEVYSDLKQQ